MGLQSTVVGLVFTPVGFDARTADMEGKLVGLGGKPADLATQHRGARDRGDRDEVRIVLSGDILFDFDKATLRSEATPVLERVAETIRNYGKPMTRTDSHNDSRAGTTTTWSGPRGAPIP